jgi:hypothetical protein
MKSDAPSDFSYPGERQILLKLIHNLIDRPILLAHKIADERYQDPLSESEWQVLIDGACRMLYHRSAHWKH